MFFFIAVVIAVFFIALVTNQFLFELKLSGLGLVIILY